MLTRREKRAQAPIDPAAIPPPQEAFTEQQDEILRDAFTFPTVKRYTSFVQYRADRADVASIAGDTWHRGEVKRVMSKTLADSIVSTGQCAHVAIGTPLGQPEEFRPKATNQQPPTNNPTAPQHNNGDAEEGED